MVRFWFGHRLFGGLYIPNDLYGLIMKWYNKEIKRIRPQGKEVSYNCLEPKAGFVYGIKGGNFVKVGCSTNPKKRMVAHQVSNPHKLELLFSVESDDMFESEEQVQLELRKFKVRGEWYRLTPKVKEYIKLVKKHNKLFPMKWITNMRKNPHNPLFNGEWKR